MIDIILYEPEIPPNTGNIIRLCANSGAKLHLIHPLGFELNSKQCRRAGLDYKEMAHVFEYEDYEQFLTQHPGRRIFACTTKANQAHSKPCYKPEDMLLFGPETRGLPDTILSTMPQDMKIRIPMLADSRSLNLSNATAIILYESLRQLGFPHLIP